MKWSNLRSSSESSHHHTRKRDVFSTSINSHILNECGEWNRSVWHFLLSVVRKTSMQGGGGGKENFLMSSNNKTREKKRTKDNYLKYSLYKDELNPSLPYKENVNTRREKPRNVRAAAHISLSMISFSIPPLANLTFLLSLTFVRYTFIEISNNVFYLKFKRK